MAITAAEQYAMELLNRARLDPAAEAARYGVNLYKGIPKGEVNASQKQVLAYDPSLDKASTNHTSWMLRSDTFSHTGVNGTDPGDRMAKAGYSFKSGGWSWGENLAFVGMGGRTAADAVAIQHGMLMRSDGHRENIMRDNYREVGYSQVIGDYKGGRGSMVTEKFASRIEDKFVTGVAYNDKNGNSFYNAGEGRKGVDFAMDGGGGTETAAAGGYALKVTGKSVDIDVGGAGTVQLNVAAGNVKLDLVGSSTVFVSTDATIIDGITNIRLLGINDDRITGSDEGNRMWGNKGDNTIQGGAGNDELIGGMGRDKLTGGADNDTLSGGDGNDTLNGGTGDDRMTGGAGADHFEFTNRGGNDVITDFSTKQGDRIALDAALWDGDLAKDDVVGQFAKVVNGSIEFEFANGETLKLQGFTNLNALADAIVFI